MNVVSSFTIARPSSSRFIDHATCSMCGAAKVGVEFHGVLLSGASVNQLAAHTPGKRSVQRGQPRCVGAGMRVALAGGAWKGLR